MQSTRKMGEDRWVKNDGEHIVDVKKIAIIGAGIGGLAAALALQRRGFRVAVYERAKEIREIGAGVIITANARRDAGSWCR